MSALGSQRWVIATFVVGLCSSVACNSSEDGTVMPPIVVAGAGGVSGASAGGGAGGVAGMIGGAGGAAGMIGGGAGGVGAGAGGVGGGGAGGTGGAPQGDCSTGACWTYLGYDIGSSFHNPNETTLSTANVSQLTVKWTAETTSAATGTAAVVGDTVYFYASGDTWAFNRADGTMRWHQKGGGSGSVTYDNGKLFVQNPIGVLRRLDAATGVEEWTFPGGNKGNSVGTPLVVGNKVIYGLSSSDEWAGASSTFRGQVIAVDKDLGTELWRFDTIPPSSTGDGAPVWSSPSVDPELGYVFVTSGNNYYTVGGDSDSIIAIDLETGGRVWAFQSLAGDIFNGTPTGIMGKDYDFGTNPILFEAAGKKMVGAGSKSGIFYARDRMTGAEAWTKEVTTGCALGGILNNGAYDGTRIYVASFPCTLSIVNGAPTIAPGTPVVTALNPADGTELWKVDAPAQSWGPVTVANGILFVAANTRLRALDAATGMELFSYEAGGSISSAPVVVDGQVIFGAGIPPADAFNLVGATAGTKLHMLALP